MRRSATVAAMGPGVSRLGASGRRPSIGMLPVVTFRPKVPQNDDGIRMDPPVSEPVANGTIPAATAAAEPPLDPPVILAASQGLHVRPCEENRFVPPRASSCWFVLPIISRPSALIRATF